MTQQMMDTTIEIVRMGLKEAYERKQYKAIIDMAIRG